MTWTRKFGEVPATMRAPVVLLGLAGTLLVACKDQGPEPRTASMTVFVAMTGEDLDTTSYRVSVDGAVRQFRSGAGSLDFEDLEPGEHEVVADGFESNCSVTGDNPQTVEVVAGERLTLTFHVECERRDGTIRVSTSTAGVETDADGYVLAIDDLRRIPVAAGDVVTFADLYYGVHLIALEGVARNCSVAPSTSRDVRIEYADTMDVSFAVGCVESGSVQITANTSGDDPDGDGYTVTLAGTGFDTTATVASGGSVTFPGFAPGDYVITVRGVSANCDVLGEHPRSVALSGGSTATATFDVACAAATDIAFVSDRDGNGEIYLVSTDDAAMTRLTTNSAEDWDPAWSPDGMKLAFASDRDGDGEIYVMNADGSNQVRLTTSSGLDEHPSWSPDGSRIAFVSSRDGDAEIYVMNADGSSPVRITDHPSPDTEPAWSPLGDRIAFVTGRHGAGEIYVMNADGSGAIPLTTSPEPEHEPAWSPDGSRIAFARGHCQYYDCPQDLVIVNADGSFIRRFGADGLGDGEPSWSPNGRKLVHSVFTPYYYVDYSGVGLRIARADGTEMLDLVVSNAYDPAWQP